MSKRRNALNKALSITLAGLAVAGFAAPGAAAGASINRLDVAELVGEPEGGLRALMDPDGDSLICRHTGAGLAILARLSSGGEVRWSRRLEAADGGEVSCERVSLHPDGSAWFSGAFEGEVDFGEATLAGGGRFAMGYDLAGGFLGGTWRVGPDDTVVNVIPDRQPAGQALARQLGVGR